MLQRLSIQLRHAHDFYYGYKVLQPGDTIDIVISEGQYGADIRVVKSTRETYPGWGIGITQYELDAFKAGRWCA
jgi:hypothetical protein